mgnify:CR=1 FL=1
MTKFNITLSAQQLEVVAAGLGELPLRVSKSTHDEISAQISAQGKDENAGFDPDLEDFQKENEKSTDDPTPDKKATSKKAKADPDASAKAMTGTDHS